MAKLQQKLRELSQKYNELKVTEEYSVKFQISKQLVKLCADAQKCLQSQLPSSKNVRHKTQINNIRNTALQVNKEARQLIDNHGKRKIDLSSSSMNVNQKSNSHKNEQLSYQQKSKRICQTIVEQEFSSKQVKIDPEQLQKIVNKMQKNLEIQTQIKQMLVQQNDNLDIIQENIKKTYELTQDTNQELQVAVDRKFRARLRKIKLGLTGIIAVIGYGILGLPGLIVGGVVGLYKTIF